MKISNHFFGKKAAITALGAVLLGLAPVASVFAHERSFDQVGGANGQANIAMQGHYQVQQGNDNENENDDDNGMQQMFARAVTGSITALGSDASSFTLTAANKAVYTVQINANTKLQDQTGSALAFSDLAVSDKVIVKGNLQMPFMPMVNNTNNTQTGNVITALIVTKIPQNTHPAHASGTVTAVSGNNITLQINPGGVAANVPVVTSANTTVVNKDGSPATLSDIQANSRIRVKGLWDEVLNVLDAIKIRILG